MKKDKIIWITGASSGIGEHLAYEFSKLGHFVILSSRHLDTLKAVQSKLAHPEKSLIEVMDVSHHEAIKNHYQHIVDHCGTVDILINNAGISQRGAVLDTDLSIDKKIFDINFFGNIALTKAVLPDMIKHKNGNIVVISSLAGKMSTGYRSAYAASKHALHGWYDALRAEVADKGVSVNMICPGYIRTDISLNAVNEKGEKHGEMDPNQNNGLAPDECAKRIIKAIEQNKIETNIGGKEVHYLNIKKFVPSLYHKIIRKKAQERSF